MCCGIDLRLRIRVLGTIVAAASVGYWARSLLCWMRSDYDFGMRCCLESFSPFGMLCKEGPGKHCAAYVDT